MQQINILVVEDIPTDILLIKEYLNESLKQVFDVFEAETLQSAVKLINHYDFDAVLLDLNLPDSTGLDTMRKIVNIVPEIPVVILSGVNDEDIAIQAVRYGAQDYLDKQYLSPGNLLKSLNYSIERKKSSENIKDLLDDLDLAFRRVELLENLLPLCLSCKKIQGEDNKWYELEQYNGPLSRGQNSQPLCPGCMEDLQKSNTST